ncbi:hypothetical protein HA466_0080810 [Hirschfeldia incana]|nr:hypothetical protein HA466_0080810 [Hirschfeldia incana]
MDSSPPIPSRSKPRNSETGDLMRRSFRASPFPGKTTRSESSGDKENKEQISDLVKAPPKPAKNFMSPTISAVSKINPSPRKKILSERNELSRSFDKTNHHHPQVRSSVTFSDVVSFIGEEDKDKDQIFIGEKKKLDDDDDVTVTDMDDSSFDVSPLPPTSVAPFTFPVFEGDASVTPYDPKKNYLSPRPQFLHYRPNPRLERKQLDELFSSESSSTDTDLSAEESQHEEEVLSQQSVVEEEAEESKQVEEVVVAVKEEAEVTLDEDDDDEEHLEAVESEEEETVVGETTEEAEETHQVSKQSRFKTSKLLGWVLVLGLLVSSVMFTLPNINEGSQFYKFHIKPETAKSARESFEHLSEKIGMWAGSSLVYMDKLISSLRANEGYGPFQFHNLTGVLEETRLSDAVFQPASGEISVAGPLVDRQHWSLEMGTEEESGVTLEPEELESSGEIDLEVVYEESANGFEQESEGGEGSSEMVYKFDEQTEITVAIATEVNVGESLSEEAESGGQETDGVEEQREFEEDDQKKLEGSHEYETRSGQNDEKMMEESESNAPHLDAEESAEAISEHQQEEGGIGESTETNPETVQEGGGIGETAETSLDISAETSDVDGNDMEEESGIGEEVSVNAEDWKEFLLSNGKKVMVLVSTVMVMLAAAAAAFLFAKKKVKSVVHEDVEPTTVPDATKVVNVEHAPVENLIKERISSLSFQKEGEVNDESKREEVSSFPSEMSFSSHKDRSLRSCSNRDEYHSGVGGKKSNDSGESMASSASEYSIGGSVSYGSFTTYEKIQKRSGRKEEEMVTPVRRSSRIRNHQHSGQ